jgi:serine protease Do
MKTSKKAFFTALSVGVLAAASIPFWPATTASTTAGPATTGVQTADDLSAAFADVAEEVHSAVVSIRSIKEVHPVRSDMRLPAPFEDSPLGELFGKHFGPFQGPSVPDQGLVEEGQASGFVTGDDGYILTNNHVVGGADQVRVTLSDGSTYGAEVVGTDPATDLAVIKIDAGHLTSIPLGDSDNLEVGEWVVAAGNPFGLSSTITAGIVSAKGRNRMGIVDYEDFIQTDAAINPGNSGGPLVNLHGQVVGINTAILTRTGANMGVGFAIPINMAKSVMKDLIEHGSVVRGFLGVQIQNLNKDLASSFGFNGTAGALVASVQPDTPAEKAGIKVGDIITEFDGKPVTDIDSFRFLVARTAPGTKADVTVFRDGESTPLTVTVGELAPMHAAAQSGAGTESEWGMAVQTLTPDLAARLGYDQTMQGVVVTQVDPLGAAADAGIRPLDVITEVQGRAVGDAREFHRILEKSNLSKGVRLTLRSGDAQRFVFFRLTD